MFTLKLYAMGGTRMSIVEAERFTVLQVPSNTVPFGAEITAHRAVGFDERFDVHGGLPGNPHKPLSGGWEKAIIENSAGRTTEIIGWDVPSDLSELKAAPAPRKAA